MHRGYIREWRKEMDSEIWDMPPLYFKIWRYLIMAADYKTHTLTTTCNIIADKILWYENGCPKCPSRKTVRKILLWLHAKNQVAYDVSGTGPHKRLNLTIINYETYNPTSMDPGNKEETNEGQVVKEVQRSTTSTTSEIAFPKWVDEVLSHWESVRDLPKQANRTKCLKTIHDLHRLDNNPPPLIHEVVDFIVREKDPRFIASPMKLRSTTRAGDQQTFDMYAREYQALTPAPEERPWIQ